MEKRIDAENSMFIREQLESVKGEVFTQYPIGKYASLIPVDSSDDEGAEEVGYLQYDSIGAAEIIANGTTDSPAVDALVQKVLLPVKEIGNHFTWTTREVRNAALAQRNGNKRAKLDSTKLSIAATSHEQAHDKIAILGDGTKDRTFGGCYGIVFHPNVTKLEASDAWSDLTNAQILEEFAKMEEKIVVDTKEIYRPDTFAMDGALISFLRGRIIDGTTRTLYDVIRDTYSSYNFETHYALKDVKKNPATGASGATRVLLCYKKSPDVIRYKMPMAFKTEPAVFGGRDWRVETSSTSAGVEVRQPLAVLVYYGF